MHKNAPTLLLTINDILHLTGYTSKSSIYRLVKRGDLPSPIVIGGGRVRWRSSEIEQWLQNLPTQNYS